MSDGSIVRISKYDDDDDDDGYGSGNNYISNNDAIALWRVNSTLHVVGADELGNSMFGWD